MAAVQRSTPAIVGRCFVSLGWFGFSNGITALSIFLFL